METRRGALTSALSQRERELTQTIAGTIARIRRRGSVGLLSIPGLFGGGSNNGGGGIFVSLIIVAANAFIVWALATTGGWFAARST